MVSSAGRGRPRPLLAGVFRKACDYCVRSKRGCNGGTPCEQCIRREQPCTYSQRRKSGPRGRPVRQQQQQATPPPSVCNVVGTRISARRTKGTSSCFSRDDGSPEPSTPHSAASSPTRTASMSSSRSDYSLSDDCSSDSEAEASVEADQKEEEQEQQQQTKKKSRTCSPMGDKKAFSRTITSSFSSSSSSSSFSSSSSVSRQDEPVSPPPPPPLLRPAPSKALRLFATQPQQQQQQQVTNPKLPKVSALVNAPSAASARRVVQPSPPPLQHLATSSFTWSQPLLASEPSITLRQQQEQQQQQQQQRSTDGEEGGVPTATASSVNSLIHEISMQPWEIAQSGARPVISEAAPETTGFAPAATAAPDSGTSFTAKASAGFTSQPLAGVSMDVTGVSMDVTGAGPAQPRGTAPAGAALHAAAPQASSSSSSPSSSSSTSSSSTSSTSSTSTSTSSTSFGGALFTQQGDFCQELSNCQEYDDFDLDCPHWQMPSLTREMSLARVVDSLGGENSAQQGGVGFEGTFSSW